MKLKLKRRDFLKGAVALLGTLSLFRGVKIYAKVKDSKEGVLDQNVRMLKDLERALAKPVEERKWGMVIDVQKCIGCRACVVACIAENNLPPGVTLRQVFEVEDGEYPEVKRYFKPTNCMQCDDPPCVKEVEKVAPGAMYKRADGIVAVNYSKFKDKKAFEVAQKACPFHALYWDTGDFYTKGTPSVQPYENRKVTEFNHEIKKGRKEAFGRKCHFCLHRIENGLLPACVSTCTGGAMYFGDLNDPDSLVSKLVKERKTYRLEMLSVKPRIYYLHGKQEDVEELCGQCHG